MTAGELDGPLIRVAARGDAEPEFQRRTRMWKQPELKLAPHMAIRGTYLSINPALALHALSYDLAQPGARRELGTEAGVDRVRNGYVASLR